jgi:membrane-associated phospholipid phosphatase
MPSFPHSLQKPLAVTACWPALALRLGVGAALLAAGLLMSGHPIDRQWCIALQASLSSWPTAWSLLTWSALGISSLLLVACLSDEAPRRVAGMMVAMVIGGVVVHTMKSALHVDRPLEVFGTGHPVFHVIGESLRKGSMPSGHTVTAWTVAGLMTLPVAHAAYRPPTWRRVLRWGWWLLAGLQGLSRVMVGAHWPSDVLAGAGLGLLLAPLVWHLGVTQGLGQWLARPTARPWVAGVLPVLAVLLCLMDLGSALPATWRAAIILLGLYGALRWGRTAPKRVSI